MIVYEVWRQDYDTFGEGEKTLAYRFDRETTAYKMAEKLSEGWGSRAFVRETTVVPILDTTAEQVEEWWENDRYDPLPGEKVHPK